MAARCRAPPGERMGFRKGLAAVSGLLSAVAFPASAQSFDCAKAGAPLEKVICASPTLMRQDKALAEAYAQALSANPAHADETRQAQRRWLRERAACVGSGPEAPSGAPACLGRLYADRIAALAAAPVAQATPPAAATPPPPAAPPTPLPAAVPSVPPGPAPGRAAFDRDRFPAAEHADTLLRVATPGRYAIRAESASGTAIQLVDMLSGPGDLAGQPGEQDGRLDALLDAGTYKLRTFGAKGAAGETRLVVTPFADAAPPQAALAPGAILDGTLADLQQRLIWLVVGADGRVRVEAAGRSLRDLRLWRNGRDLVDLVPATRTSEPAPAHPLTGIVLEGKVEPGTYLAAAYGGPALAWTDGATDQPFHLRIGAASALLDGAASGRIGPFGSEVFAVPPGARRVGLRLPAPAPAQLLLRRDGEEVGRAEILRESRDPAVALDVPAGAQPRLVELRGAAGQDYALRTFPAVAKAVSRPGTYWIGVQAEGAGGDEPPPSFVLLRRHGTAAQVVAGEGPRIESTHGWHARFNLRGPASLLFEVGSPTEVAIRTDGPGVETAILTLDGHELQPRGDGRARGSLALDPGWYQLVVAPRGDAVGVLDLVLGAPGRPAPALAAAWPASPVIPVGVQSLGDGESLLLRAGSGVGIEAALVARPAPVDLAKGALVVTQRALEALDIPVHVPGGDGTLASRDLANHETGATLGATSQGQRPSGAGANLAALHVPGGAESRTVTLAWRAPPPAPPPPRPETPASLPELQAGQPLFLTLGRDERRSFALTVATGGLYRVETLGRLKTAGTLATSFIPALDSAEANGVGQNMLIARPLRAGRYTLSVKAEDSAGRLGIVARPAPLLDGAALLPGGSVRAGLPAGSGLVVPIEIAAAGTFRLDLLGLAADAPTARLDDEEGWPLLPAAPLATVERELPAGRYRLVVMPRSVDARVVARLDRVTQPQEITPQEIIGHGPHPLPFEVPQAAEWREPAGRDDPRTPDAWDFTLHGPSDLALTLSDGMVADLRRRDAPNDAPPATRLVGPAPATLRLGAGEYRIAATSLGRNDRLGYTLVLHSDQLQPGIRREVKLPATVPLSIAAARVVSLTTFGKVPLTAVLRAADGRAIARADGRTGDWNIALSRALPAGSYTLELATLAPPEGGTPVADRDVPPGDSDSGTGANTEQGAQEPQASSGEAMHSDSQAPSGDQASGQDAPDSEGGANEQAPAKTTELTLALPAIRPAIDAPADGALALQGGGVHVLTLPPAPAGGLLLATADSSAELVLSLERRDASGAWISAGQDQGLAPLLATPADGAAPGAWRATVWAVDGGAAPIRFAARAVQAEPQIAGTVALAPVPLGELGTVRTALVRDPGAAMLRVGGAGDADAGVLAASLPGRPATAPDGSMLAPQSSQVWFVTRGRDDAALTVSLVAAPLASTLEISVPEGGSAALPGTPVAANRLRAWRAESGLGQPGIEAGRGMGVAPASAGGSALALDAGGVEGEPVRVWNAGSGDALRLRLSALDLRLAEPRGIDAALTDSIPPATALPILLPPGPKRLDLTLGPNTAAVAGWRADGAVTTWAGGAPLSRSLQGEWTELLLVNPGDSPSSVTLAATALDRVATLAPGGMVREFHGAAGSLDISLDARQGQRLFVAGAEAVFLGHDGRVRRGGIIPLGGAGELTLTHAPGLLAAWIEGEGASPWPDLPPQDATPPARIALAGPAMALRLNQAAPVLLRARSTAPVILAFGDAPPRLYPAGVDAGQTLPAGATLLRVLSPHDGTLSGTLELTATPILDTGEGVGTPVALAPGGTVLWSFDAARAGPVGLGVRAEPDRVSVRLLDAEGRELGTGVAQLRTLKPGRYLLEAALPPDAPTAIVRPAVLGIAPRPEAPPPELVRRLLVAAGLTPPDVSLDSGDTR